MGLKHNSLASHERNAAADGLERNASQNLAHLIAKSHFNEDGRILIRQYTLHI